jgi:hypothetical protein
MKKKHLFSAIIVFLISLPQQISSQESGEVGVKEIEEYYSEKYITPRNIEFVFSGDKVYLTYFFSDLEEKIKKRLAKENIEFSFRYADTKPHFKSKRKTGQSARPFHLHISNSKVLDEKNGYDRTMVMNLNGKLIDKASNSIELSFKITINSIHDITSQNEAVLDYLISKIKKE